MSLTETRIVTEIQNRSFKHLETSHAQFEKAHEANAQYSTFKEAAKQYNLANKANQKFSLNDWDFETIKRSKETMLIQSNITPALRPKQGPSNMPE